MLQFQYMAPWVPTFNQCMEQEISLNNNIPPFISFQLATIDAQGFPRNRTLVYRGFLFGDKTNNILTCTTDKRMAKYAELQHNDVYEAVFYFQKIKKQFRFRGRARLLDDHHQPRIDLSLIQPQKILENNNEITKKRDQQLDSDFDSEADGDDEALDLQLDNHRQHHPHHHHHNHHHKKVPVQEQAVASSLCSPRLMDQILKATPDGSYTNLHDLTRFQFAPPTDEEWKQEITRQWDQLSKTLRKSFRKPSLLDPMTDDNHKLIDSISRGVDGKKDEAGLKNFAVVALFVEHVDFVELDKDRRCLYDKDSHQQWNESEVCP